MLELLVSPLAALNVSTTISYLIALAIILAARLICPIIAYILIAICHKIIKAETKTTESGFYGPIKFIITVMGFGAAIYYLALPIGIIKLYNEIFKILLILAIARSLSNSLKPDSTFFTKLESSTKFRGNEALNSFIGKILKAIIYIVAAFLIMHNLGYDLGGLAAGLGIGSAVIALAFQDMAKSLIGGFSLITDKPFEIGDYIEVGEFSGTVIDITFRSTRLKDVRNTIISLPNSVIVSEYVKNWSKLENRRLDMTLRLSLNSSTETITRCISKIKTVLRANEDIVEDTIMVHLDTIEADANIIVIVAYINTSEYLKYLDVKEKINCDILTVLEREKIELVYPTQQVYTKAL